MRRWNKCSRRRYVFEMDDELDKILGCEEFDAVEINHEVEPRHVHHFCSKKINRSIHTTCFREEDGLLRLEHSTSAVIMEMSCSRWCLMIECRISHTARLMRVSRDFINPLLCASPIPPVYPGSYTYVGINQSNIPSTSRCNNFNPRIVQK